MLVRLGYVAMSLKLENCSPSKTITVGNYERIEGEENRRNRLRRITKENLQNCARLLYYNAAHHIHLFRFTSKLVPLATHPLTAGWDYCEDCKDEFAKIGAIAAENKMRVSSHPDHFTLINSLKEGVFEASLRDLEYHDRVFAAMGLDDAQMIMHVGGLYGCGERIKL
ncbi:MAG: UV DNA damage repair endonuclease UvsE [Firmicutes bacterium]|nr:UV DNA damage repair endonuclease UvsE [Bacillota bacterium]